MLLLFVCWLFSTFLFFCVKYFQYFRWFNQTISKQSSLLSLDPSNKLIRSTAGIRVVEIRSLNRELVLHSWMFDGRILKFSFQIPEDLLITMGNGSYLIFVEDTIGCILKEELNV